MSFCLQIDLSGLRSQVQVSGNPWPETWPDLNFFWNPWPDLTWGCVKTPDLKVSSKVSGTGLRSWHLWKYCVPFWTRVQVFISRVTNWYDFTMMFLSFFIGWRIRLLVFLHPDRNTWRKKTGLKIDLSGLRSQVQVSGDDLCGIIDSIRYPQ